MTWVRDEGHEIRFEGGGFVGVRCKVLGPGLDHSLMLDAQDAPSTCKDCGATLRALWYVRIEREVHGVAHPHDRGFSLDDAKNHREIAETGRQTLAAIAAQGAVLAPENEEKLRATIDWHDSMARRIELHAGGKA